MASRALTRAKSDPHAVASAATPAGTVAAFFLSAAPSGWLKANGSTIGSATSGATRANADTAALFAALWANTELAILTSAGGGSTRGANATADFAAGKRLTLPDVRGEFVRGLDDGRGVDGSRGLATSQAQGVGVHGHTASGSAASAGAHTHTGTAASAGAHTHNVDGGTQAGTGSYMLNTSNGSADVPTSSAGAHTHTVSVTSAGAHTHDVTVTVADSAAGENRPRNVAALICVKL